MSDTDSCPDVSFVDINILLLGERSIGKSTFINSFGNYLSCPSLDRAIKSDLIFLIPTEFSTTDEHFEECVVRLSEDEDKDIIVPTQESKCYVFPIRGQNLNINLIDTPGIGDGRNGDQDLKNFDNILSYVSQFDHLNAICFFMNPSIVELSDYYKFCFTNLLRRLGPTASKKVAFVINKSRGSFYKPEGSITILRPFLKSIQDEFEVECSKKNIFCMDNEGFRYLAALKNGHSFGEMEESTFRVSWEVSVEAVKSLLAFSKMNEESDFISVTKHRLLSMQLLKPLSDVVALIKFNVVGLMRHKDFILSKSNQAEDIMDLLFMPEICFDISNIGGEIVCLSNSCKKDISDSTTSKKLCQSECTLNIISGSLIGCPELLAADVFAGSQECSTCGCDVSTHVYNLYEIEKYLSKKMANTSEQSEAQIKQIFELIGNLEKRQNKYEKELKKVLKLLANIYLFLKSSEIVERNDAFLELLEHHVKCEKESSGENMNKYESILKKYQEELKNIPKDYIVDPKNCIKVMLDIFRLENVGETTRCLYNMYIDLARSRFTDTMKYCFELDFFPEDIQAESENDSDTQSEEDYACEDEEGSDNQQDETDYDNLSETNDDNFSVTTNEVEENDEDYVMLTKSMSQQSLASNTTENLDNVKLNNVDYKHNDLKKEVNKSADDVKQQNVQNPRSYFRGGNYNRRGQNRQHYNQQNRQHYKQNQGQGLIQPIPLMQIPLQLPRGKPQYQPFQQPGFPQFPIQGFPPHQLPNFPQGNQFHQDFPHQQAHLNPNTFPNRSNSPSLLNDPVLMDALKKQSNLQHGVNLHNNRGRDRGGIFKRGRGNYNSNSGGGNRERYRTNPSTRDSSCSRNSSKNFGENRGGRGGQRQGNNVSGMVDTRNKDPMKNQSKPKTQNSNDPNKPRNLTQNTNKPRNQTQNTNKPRNQSQNSHDPNKPKSNQTSNDPNKPNKTRVTCAVQNSTNSKPRTANTDGTSRKYNQSANKSSGGPNQKPSNSQNIPNTGAIKKAQTGRNQNIGKPQSTGATKNYPPGTKGAVNKPSNSNQSQNLDNLMKNIQKDVVQYTTDKIKDSMQTPSIVFNIQNNNDRHRHNGKDCVIS